MKTCCIYLRVSTEVQAKEGFSIDNQRRACLEYAKNNEYEVKEVFVDDGRSARTTDRPEFQRMLQSSKEDHIEAVIVYKIDRFARNVADFSNIRKQFKNDGIKLISLVEGGDVTEGLIGNIFASVAEWESEINGSRTKDAMNQKFREGWWPTLGPYGYKNIQQGNKRIVVPDLKLTPLIKEAYELYSTGMYSYMELCEIMYNKGLASRIKNEVMSDTSLQAMLSNPFYYGLMRRRGCEDRIGNHKPIVTKTLFDQCQYIAAKHRQFLVRARKHSFLLRGFVYCAEHNTRLSAEWHFQINSRKKDKVGYYHCCVLGGCKGSYVNVEKLERIVANYFKRFEFAPEFIELVREKVKEYFENSRNETKSEDQAIVNKRKALEAKRNKLEDLLVEGAIDRDIFKRQHTQLQGEIKQLENERLELDSKREVDVQLIDEVLALTRNIYKTYCEAPDYLKRHYLRFFFEGFYIKDKKVAKVIETPIFSTLRKEHQLLIKQSWLPR